MFSTLQPARLSLLVLLLVSFVLSDDAHHNSSLKKVESPEAFARQNVAEVLSVRQEESSETGGLLPSSGFDQASSGGVPTSTGPPESDSTTPSPTPTPTDPPTTSPTDTGPTSSPPPDSSDSSSSKPTSDSSKQSTSSPTPTSKHSTTSAPESTFTQRYTTVHEVTSNGRVYSTTDVSTSLIPTNTAAPIDSSPNTSDGMSPQTRKTVIGVVVGIGGAIFFALVFLVFWKFWGRRRSARRAQEDDALMMTSPGEKSDSMSASNPFQSTLESYHAPQRPVNASSNF